MFFLQELPSVGKRKIVAVFVLLSGCHLLTQGVRGSAETFYCLRAQMMNRSYKSLGFLFLT